MDLWIIRALLLAAILVSGYFIRPFGLNLTTTLSFSAALGLFILFAEIRIRRLSVKTLLGAAIGSILGILGASLISLMVARMSLLQNWPAAETLVQLLVLILMTYIGLISGANKGEYLDLSSFGGIFTENASRKTSKVLDTSVIIDGRVADICKTGFLEGALGVPHFVLRELQQIADSADSAKRNRGRRGLDVLEKIKSVKLIELAKETSAKIVTNDFNLNKVSQLRGVDVLNINELANALKPVVLPGETMKVFILKEGKEYNQGVAYLDDGTMVVVDNARRMIGKTIATQVTSVLQTTAGKMIFGRFPEEAESNSGSQSPRQDRRSYDKPSISNHRFGVEEDRERVKGGR